MISAKRLLGRGGRRAPRSASVLTSVQGNRINGLKRNKEVNVKDGVTEGREREISARGKSWY